MVKYSLRTILVFFVALFLSFNLSQLFSVGIIQRRTLYSHDYAHGKICEIRWRILEKNKGSTDVSDEFIKGAQSWISEFEKDPWGQPYQIILKSTLENNDGLQLELHVYSYGADKVSRSQGNDRDDINSWSYHRSSYYEPLVLSQRRLKRFLNSIWLLPIVTVLMLMSVKMLKSRRERNWTR